MKEHCHGWLVGFNNSLPVSSCRMKQLAFCKQNLAMEYLCFWALYFITGTSHQLMYSWNRTQVVLRISLISFVSLDIVGSITEALLTDKRCLGTVFSLEMGFECEWNHVWNVAVLNSCLDFLSSRPHQHHHQWNSAAEQTCRHAKVPSMGMLLEWLKSCAFGASVFVFFHQVKVSLPQNTF